MRFQPICLCSQLLITLFITLLLGTVQSQVVTPTSSDGTTEIYNTQFAGDFQNKEIVCSTSICQVICDETSSCDNTEIDASLSDTLLLECTNNNACNLLSITKPPQITAQFRCEGDHACSDANLNVSTTSDVNLDCEFTASISLDSCHLTELTADNATNVTIHCAQHSCDAAKFYLLNASTATLNFDYDSGGKQVFGSGITNGLTVNCNDYKSCYNNDIYCPNDSNCDIYCSDSGSESCNYLSIFIEDELSYDNLYLECAVSGICQWANVNCDTGQSSLEWDSGSSSYKCASFGCCNYTFETLICNDTICDIDCSVTSCENRIVDASDAATSLILRCSNQHACDGSTILCPTADGSSCEILCTADSSCIYATIKTNANYMNLLNIDCSVAYSCAPLHELWLTFIDLTTFTWSMGDSNSLHLPITSANSSASSIDTFSIECSGSSSCGWGVQFSFKQHNIDITNADITCSGSRSCYESYFYLSIIESLNIICVSSEGCKSTLFDVYLLETSVVDIRCLNIGGGNPSCYQTQFLIYSSQDSYLTSNDTVSIQCDSCQNSYFEFVSIDQVSMECAGNAVSSCNAITVNASDTMILNYKCNQCKQYQSNIYCPDHSINSCNIDLSCDSSIDCAVSHIFVSSQFQRGFLSFISDIDFTYQNGNWIYCGDAINGYGVVPIESNTNTNTTQCGSGVSNYNYFCCPWYTDVPTTDPTINPTTNEPTTIPTIDPTNDPTTDPTLDPTNEPTTNPSDNPSIDPTFDPTNEPTIDPTTIPTIEPTTNPTNYLSTVIISDTGLSNEDNVDQSSYNNCIAVLNCIFFIFLL